MRKLLHSEAYLWAIIAGLFATNFASIFQVRRLLKSFDLVIEQREDLSTALEETTGQRDQLWRIVSDSEIELSEFDRVFLDTMAAKLNELHAKYSQESDDA